MPHSASSSSLERAEVELRAILDAVENVLADLLPAASDCRGILFTGQMGGVILADRRGSPTKRATVDSFSGRLSVQ
jgi:sugar (pentulose or hexulose) kinase